MTNEKRWTPGPWHVFDGTTVYGPTPPEEYVAECPYADSPEASLDSVNKATARANANLIAAAPEMYEALRVTRDRQCERCAAGVPFTGGPGPAEHVCDEPDPRDRLGRPIQCAGHLCEADDLVMRVLSKARGEVQA